MFLPHGQSLKDSPRYIYRNNTDNIDSPDTFDNIDNRENNF